jgi:hypothetical protein
MKKDNKSIDKMAEQFTSPEELQAYSEAQYKTILNLNEKLNNLQKELETVKAENSKLRNKSVIQESTVPADSKFKTTDEETACVVQIAILKNHALERELVTDEVKRLEILTKTLHLIRGKVEDPKKEKGASDIPSEDLQKMLNSYTTDKDPQ